MKELKQIELQKTEKIILQIIQMFDPKESIFSQKKIKTCVSIERHKYGLTHPESASW